MKLNLLHENCIEDLLANSIGINNAKKLKDPGRPEKIGDANKELPARSGNQDTPLKPRHRKYFNSPLGSTQGKISFGEIERSDEKRAKPIKNSSKIKPKFLNEP